MNGDNPYAAPASDPVPVELPSEAVLELASLGQRFAGAIIDSLIGLVVIIPLIVGVTYADEWDLKLMDSEGNMSLPVEIGLSAVFFAITMAIQYKFLLATGQTIGKKVAKIRIVTMAGNKPPLMDLVFKRYGFVSLLTAIPRGGEVLSVVDVLFIFRKDRRCLHDLVAGTQVVKVTPGM